MMNFLSQIIEDKKKELKTRKFYFPLTKFIKKLTKSTRSFKRAFNKEKLILIAEIKKASPSAGIIKKDFNLDKINSLYQKYASAISVVTEEKYFHGKLAYLEKLNEISALPLLRKDFIIDEYQIYESRYYGADAILLIAALLKRRQINKFINLAKKYHMYCLVEVHTLSELKKVLKTKAEIIGINNRDLQTFAVDLKNSLALAPLIPNNKIIVAESGIKTTQDLKTLRGNVHGVLVGTALLKSSNLNKTLKKWSDICNKPVTQDEVNKQLTLI